MSWHQPIIEVRQAHLRATMAEHAGLWHIVAQHYHYCLERAHEANDERAIRFFASKLSVAYGKMGLPLKADYYRHLCR